jgi:hypothetical protein
MKFGAETLEHRIRERAYHLWEASGRPSGRDVEFWHRACGMVATDGADQPKAGAQQEQTKSARQAGKRTRKTSRPASQATSIPPG